MSVAQLQNETTAICDLHELLKREYSALEMRNLPDLIEIIARKQTCITQLQSLAEQRLRQANAAGAGDFDIAVYISQAPPDQREQLGTLWTALQELTEKTQWQNETNGAIIASSRTLVQQALTILRGHDPQHQLYGRDAQITNDGGVRAFVKA